MAPTLYEIAHALELSKPRVEQWLSRGHLRPADQPETGLARDWKPREVLAIGVMARLVPAVPIAKASEIAFRVLPDDHTTLVVWQGFYRDQESGSFTAAGDRDHWWDDQIGTSDLTDLVARHEIERALIVPLFGLIARVNRLFES